MKDTPLPLDGIRVLDIATFLAGPFCSSIMGEFGADVIKIEQPGVGDPLRKFGTPTESGDSLVFLSEARNKKSISLDLRQPEGVELLKRLVAISDVVVENFRTGTLEKWGVGYEHLSAVNAGLVMLRVTGYGQTGPKSKEPGFARIAHAFSGLSYLAGEPGGPPLMPGSTSLADYLAGTYGAIGVLMALRHRDRTGEGQYIDIALYEPIFRYLDEIVPAFARHGFVRERMGADTVNVVPHSHYPTQDGKHIAIACTSDKMFARLAEVIGQPELARDDRFGKVSARLQARDEVNRIVAEWTSSKLRNQALEELKAGEVPSGPIYNIAEIFADPHYAARGVLEKVMDERVGEVTVPAVMPKLSKTPGRIKHLGPPFAAHNDDIYGKLLGLSRDEQEALKAKGVI
ncbi:MAG: CaiB/BaiF CoA-transferase family protein [SAR324 cluster bacterium]|nr:CaiB/BaiF CoA-transferase family protein [SAR324 cluster bacterium]